MFNADEVYDVNNLRHHLPDLVQSAKTIYTDVDRRARVDAPLEKYILGSGTRVEGMQAALKHATVKPLMQIMNGIRLTKSEAEKDCMRVAGSISGLVYTDMMKRQYNTEKQLWVDMAHGFRSRGLDGDAYVPVVAGGKNGLSIHYTRNDAELQDGQTVLVDAGGAYGGYITDITRCWPVNGKWTDAQRDLYNMVLDVQTNVVNMCSEQANMSLDKLHTATEKLLTQGLKDLGFNLSRYDGLSKLFPHHVGHYIGLDVHDAPGFPRITPLKAGHCITIEPGIYVPDDTRWPEAFRGLAVRIEDSVIIGEEEPEILTTEAVKTVHEIEALRQQ